METSRIATFRAFAELPSAELEELASALREMEVAAGVEVVTVDDYGDALYLVEEGEAEVVTVTDMLSRTVGPGDTFGEIGLLLTGQRTATVVALTPMRLLTLSGHDFERIRARVPELEDRLRRHALERASR